MTDTTTGFAPLADAYKKQFNLELTIDDEGRVDDGTVDGVKRVGSVKSNWLKRNAPKFGFTREGEGVVYKASQSIVTPEVAAPAAAEEAEAEAVATVTDVVAEPVETVETEDAELGYTSENLEQVDISDDADESDKKSWKSKRGNHDR